MSSIKRAPSKKMKWLLQLEGAALLIMTCYFYYHLKLRWSYFFLTFLWPDLALIGYIFGHRVGGILYNLTHNLVFPSVCLFYCIIYNYPLNFPLVWLAHIGFDRALGYGLKYSISFNQTHLGPIKFKKAALT